MSGPVTLAELEAALRRAELARAYVTELMGLTPPCTPVPGAAP